jgi:uncharacterized protein YgbK (DUF1537 family)
MIAVIADDLTGAAELAGIGHRFGLTTILTRGNEIAPDVGLWVACTDSRSLPEAEARLRTRTIAENVLAAKPDWLFQKTDSVLRGHVLMELRILMEMTGSKQAVLSPANPSLGRTIRNGKCFINDIPVHEAGFATDPEFPVTSAEVLSMLRARAEEVNGITIAEVSTTDDVTQLAQRINAGTLPAGGSDFFTALLAKQYQERLQQEQEWGSPLLLISGTRYPGQRKEWKQWNVELSELPLRADDTQVSLTGEKMIIAFEEGDTTSTPAALRQYMAATIKKLVATLPQPELMIEGGATAAAILDELNETKLQPIEELAQGVVRLRGRNACFTLKPGSYAWPQTVKARLL